MTVRVRFAPSPTGKQHLGGLRSAAFNALFAKSQGGVFILRIEDTDQARFVEGSTEDLAESLKWLGIEATEGVYLDDQGKLAERGDFGPYTQSKRLPLYAKYANELLESGKAYRCFATAEELDEMRKAQQAAGLPPRYDRRFRDLPREESDRRAAAGEPFVIRQAMPLSGTTTVRDVVRGEISFNNADLDDHVLLKADGFPTYQLASVVDDHSMEISHVLRGEEWLPSAPKNVLLYEAFGWTSPVWVHIPLVLGPDKSKLSKRHGAEPILTYRDRGYLPEALLNVIAFLGWNPGTEEEMFTPEELGQRFSIERIQKAPAVFSTERLDYVNGWYIRRLPVAEVAAKMRPYLAAAGLTPASDAYLLDVAAMLQDRFKHFDETEAISWFFFKRPEVNEALRTVVTPKKLDWEQTRSNLQFAHDFLAAQTDWSQTALHDALIAAIAEAGKKNGDVLWPIRAALTGEPASPGTFEMLSILGRDESLARLDAILA